MNKLAIAFLLFASAANGQAMLTPDEAVKISLLSNFEITVAHNQALQDSIMNSPGAAGMLPSVYLNAGVGKNQNNLNQRFTNGNEVVSPNAGGTSMNAGVALSWTLFDGTKMFVTKRKLEQIEMQGDQQFRMQVLNTTSDVLIAYYDVVRQKNQLQATDEVIRYNEERVKITESRLVSGMGAKTDLLQAKIDLNVQKQQRINQSMLLTNAKHYLNGLLARDVLTDFDVIDSTVINPVTNRAELEQKMVQLNPGLLSMQTQVNIASLQYREARTAYAPTIVGNAGYNFLRNENSAGFTLYNQSYGWNAGLTLSMPLYTGGAIKRQTQVYQIEMKNASLNYENAKSDARVVLNNSIDQYDARLAALQLERENETLARENMQLSLDRLRLGQGTALEVAQAQATLADVLFRLAQLNYEAKTAEINVHRQAVDM